MIQRRRNLIKDNCSLRLSPRRKQSFMQNNFFGENLMKQHFIDGCERFTEVNVVVKREGNSDSGAY